MRCSLYPQPCAFHGACLNDRCMANEAATGLRHEQGPARPGMRKPAHDPDDPKESVGDFARVRMRVLEVEVEGDDEAVRKVIGKLARRIAGDNDDEGV